MLDDTLQVEDFGDNPPLEYTTFSPEPSISPVAATFAAFFFLFFADLLLLLPWVNVPIGCCPTPPFARVSNASNIAGSVRVGACERAGAGGELEGCGEGAGVVLVPPGICLPKKDVTLSFVALSTGLRFPASEEKHEGRFSVWPYKQCVIL
jgi:hypothetical protein